MIELFNLRAWLNSEQSEAAKTLNVSSFTLLFVLSPWHKFDNPFAVSLSFIDKDYFNITSKFEDAQASIQWSSSNIIRPLPYIEILSLFFIEFISDLFSSIDVKSSRFSL